jgi:hypothetical protein
LKKKKTQHIAKYQTALLCLPTEQGRHKHTTTNTLFWAVIHCKTANSETDARKNNRENLKKRRRKRNRNRRVREGRTEGECLYTPISEVIKPSRTMGEPSLA